MARRRYIPPPINADVKTPLPKGILKGDLTRPKYDDADAWPESEYASTPKACAHCDSTRRVVQNGHVICDQCGHPVPGAVPHDDFTFQLWLVARFGWVIPTLSIAGGGQRTYAVALAEGGSDRVQRGAQVRCGMGPHVLTQYTVHVRKSRVDALRPFLALRRDGAIDANVTRDRISSRRAQGQVERAAGNNYWRWKV